MDAATASLKCLDRALPTSANNDKKKKRKKNDDDEERSSSQTISAHDSQEEANSGVVELEDDNDEPEEEILRKLAENDARKESVKRIRSKVLMRRAKAKMKLNGWANLQGAEEDYRALLEIGGLNSADEKFVRKELRELPTKINIAKEKEVGEMMGKLKDVSSTIMQSQ